LTSLKNRSGSGTIKKDGKHTEHRFPKKKGKGEETVKKV